MSGWGCQWSGEEVSMVRAENLSGQQSADVAQVKPLLEDGGSVVADLLFLR